MRVNVPGVGEVEFPDTMSNADIARAIERDILPQQKSQAAPQKSGAEMALEGESPLERLRINLGAGIDSGIKGAQQLGALVGIGKGPSEAEIQEKRALDKAAADSVVGGGAMQAAGEIAPTLAIPGSGFVKAGQLAMRAAPTAARLGTKAAVVDSAIGGALAGATQLTSEDESWVFNTLVGAVGGSAVTGLVAGGRTIRELLAKGGAESKAAEKLMDIAGGPEAAEQALARLRAYRNPANPDGPKLTRNIPMTAAEITQNPSLGRAERTAAARYAEDWAPFRESQIKERHNTLLKATDNDLAGVTKARADATRPMRNEALQAAEGQDYTTPVYAASRWMREGGGGTNPAVQKVAEYVEKNIADATPEQLYTVRKVLLNKLNGKAQLGDELSAAVKQSREQTMGMVGAIDDALDGATGGKWSPYLKEYASKSGEVDSAEALTLIRKSFEKESAPQLGGTPVVTGHRLGKAIDKFGENSYGSKLTDEARGGLRELQDNIAMTEGLQGLLKLAGTSGGHVQTAMDLTSVAASKIPKVAEALPFIGKLMKRSDEMTQAAMSDALRNPELFIASVSKKLRQNRPLTRTEESVLALLRSAGASESLGLTAPQ